MPAGIIEQLKHLAPALGFSGYQPLIRAYVGQGLRNDLERLENNRLSSLIEHLKRHGVSEKVINQALEETAHN